MKLTHTNNICTTVALIALASAANADGNETMTSAPRSFDSVTFYGQFDVDATYQDNVRRYSSQPRGSEASDITISKFTLGAELAVSDNLTATGTVEYSEDRENFAIDIARIDYSYGDSGFSVAVGQFDLPFGSYASEMVADPLTKALGQGRETALQVSYGNGSLNVGVYAFNGDQDENNTNQLTNYGARLAYESENFGGGIDYISNIADSDGLQLKNFGYSLGADVVEGTSIYGYAVAGPVRIHAEYLQALDELAVDGLGSKPATGHVEAAYMKGDHTVAASYQKSEEALFLGLPEQRVAVAYRTTVFDGFLLGVELSQDEDYAVSDGGNGESANNALIRISLPF